MAGRMRGWIRTSGRKMAGVWRWIDRRKNEIEQLKINFQKMKPKVHEPHKKDFMNVSRRLVLTGFLAMAGMALFAQSVDKAKDLLEANKLADAKTEIDKVMASDKNQKSGDA